MTKLIRRHQAMFGALRDLEGAFPDDTFRLTIIARRVDDPTGHIVMTADTTDNAMTALCELSIEKTACPYCSGTGKVIIWRTEGGKTIETACSCTEE